MDFWNKYKILCGGKGLSPTKAAVNMGFCNSQSTSWSKGSVPKAASLQKIADYFGVDVKYFYDDEEKKEEKPEPLTSPAMGAMVMMPVIGSVKAGYGATAQEEYTGDYVLIGIDTMHNDPQGHRCLVVHGDSMYPYMIDGDILVVRLQEYADSGDVVVAIIGEDGEGTVKKYHELPGGGAELVPVNPMFPPHKMTSEDRIYGKVVELKRKI